MGMFRRLFRRSPGPSSQVVEGEWDHEVRNWRTAWRRWRRSRERFHFTVQRTETFSSQHFFVIGRASSGSVKEGDQLVMELSEGEERATRCLEVKTSMSDGEEFQILLALRLDGVDDSSGVEAGTVVRDA